MRPELLPAALPPIAGGTILRKHSTHGDRWARFGLLRKYLITIHSKVNGGPFPGFLDCVGDRGLEGSIRPPPVDAEDAPEGSV